jgi:hypothetical protein
MINKFEYLLAKIFPVLIIILSLVGNILGLVVLIKKKLKLEKIGPIIIYKYLFAYGLINSYMIILLYLHGFEIYLETISKLTCQLMVYYWYVTASILPMILVYISIERFISIKYPNKRLILNKKMNQHCFIIILIVYNLIINSWIPFNCDLIDKRNSTLLKYISNYNPNDNFECLRANTNIIYLTTLNTKIIPYSLMITFTILLIVSIFMSRSRVISNYTSIQNETFKKDVKFAFSSLSLNIIFILFNLPASVVLISGNKYHFLFLIFLYLYLFSFSIYFYLLLIFNSLFRSEFFLFYSKTLDYNNNYIRSFNLNLIIDPNVKETNF